MPCMVWVFHSMDTLVVVFVVVAVAVLVVAVVGIVAVDKVVAVVEDTGRGTGSLDTVAVEDMDTGMDSMGMGASAVVAVRVAVAESSVAVLAALEADTSSTASL